MIFRVFPSLTHSRFTKDSYVALLWLQRMFILLLTRSSIFGGISDLPVRLALMMH